MKVKGRTTPGKICLFIGCILLVAVIAASVLAACFMQNNNIYRSRDAAIRDGIADEVFNYSFLTAQAVFGKKQYPEYLSEDANLAFWLYEVDKETGETGALFYTNHESTDLSDCSGIKFSYKYRFDDSKGWNSVSWVTDEMDLAKVDGSVYRMELLLKNEVQNKDVIRDRYLMFSTAYDLRYAVYVIGAAAMIGLIFCFAALMNAAGRVKGKEGIFPGPLNIVPFDVLTVLTALAVYGMVRLLIYADSMGLIVSGKYLPNWFANAGAALIILVIVLGFCMSISARIKQRTLFSNTLIWKIIQFMRGLIRNTPVVWRAAICAAVFIVLELLFFVKAGYNKKPRGAAVWLAVKIVIAVLSVYGAVMLRKLQKGGRALAAGDLSYRVDTDGMFWDLKKHGEDLGSIAQGMNLAVEDRVKSQRMKTELITNVSHDLKTPLTSIVNYAGLIGEEETDNEKIKEYSGVLLRQSDRLKRLIDDLVEASKASTGNLDVELVPCDPKVFIEQAAGEYQDRFREAGLELIVSTDASDAKIMADGRRMQRIFDNLLNNACKYSQQGTRVFMDLRKVGGNVRFTFKNTSSDLLNIPADELMERFVRGDASRNTEGSGLGLSIAKSLAELQNGWLELETDGDLFKAILSFPVIE